MSENALPTKGDAGRRPQDERKVMAPRLESFLERLHAGETPNAGRFCAFCYNPLPPGYDRCDHCGSDAREHRPVETLPPDVLEMYRRKQRRESLVVNSFAYLGLALGVALFLGLVAVNVLYLDKAFWFFVLATAVLFVATRLFAAILGGVIGDEIGYRYANRRLAEDWQRHIATRETAPSE